MFPARVRLGILVPVLLTALTLGGCVSSNERPAALAKTHLIVTRSPQGNRLQWQTQDHVVYTVLYRNEYDRNSRWLPLPGYEYVQGTGAEKRLIDRPPIREKRRYRLQQVPLRKPR